MGFSWAFAELDLGMSRNLDFLETSHSVFTRAKPNWLPKFALR